MHILQRRRFISLVLAALAALAIPAMPAAADNPRSITVMTQNIYQGTELEHVVTATTPLQYIQGVATDYSNVIATNFPERAAAMAGEIAATQPALVGLQEVAVWRTQFPADPSTPASTVTYDFDQILVNALAARGQHYAPVATRVNFNAEGPGLFPQGLTDVRLTEETAILARTDLPTDDLVLSNPESVDFAAASSIPTLAGPFSVGGGWLSVDAKVRGKTLRFVTAHMDPFSPAIRNAQAQQILTTAGAAGLPLVIAGDLNSVVGSAAYATFVAGGLTDSWLALHPTDPGLTCCQVPPDSIVNPASQLSSRVDYILTGAGLQPLSVTLVGDQPSARTSSGLWPSDHAGIVETIGLDPLPQTVVR